MRPTLSQIFWFSLLGLFFGLVLVFYFVWNGTKKTILQSSERYRDLVSQEVAHRVTTYLEEAPMAVSHFEDQVAFGLVDPAKADSVQPALLVLLLANDHISEATLTCAKPLGKNPVGNLFIDPQTAVQVTVLRTKMAGEFTLKRTWYQQTRFVSQSQIWTSKAHLSIAPADTGTPVVSMDPTAHPTFQSAINQDNYGKIIATDLHWSQTDQILPEAQRRIELSVQKAIEDTTHHFVGVLRVGLMKSQIDGAVQQKSVGMKAGDPHLIFLCDNQGRLIAGAGAQERIGVFGDDLRVLPADIPPILMRALQEPALKDIDEEHPLEASSFQMGKASYLCTFRYLPGTQDWIVGIVVPREFYLGTLQEILNDVLMVTLVLMVLIVLGGALIITTVVQSHSLILRETARMKEFEFVPSKHRSFLQDIADVLEGMEKAKTAMRAMSKYVPVDLVREFYHKGEEPMLGGKSCELTVMFTDIKDFTTFTEKIPPDELADVLGRYLQVMAVTLQAEKGTIDKYIGDAVMTFWNAPEAVPEHEIMACRAALKCREAVRYLYGMPDWKSAPRFETRFGINRCTATVGHFGAPDRLNYTVIGDGVNLASRLEGLNKYYGTDIIVSESIQTVAREAFIFRLLDRVAVKGKSEGLAIYELIGERTSAPVNLEFLDWYQEAFTTYQRGDFALALKQFEALSTDAPSRYMAQRCRTFLEEPPPDWNGIYGFDSK